MAEEDAALILEYREKLAGSGLVVESFGPGAIIVRETPRASRKWRSSVAHSRPRT